MTRILIIDDDPDVRTVMNLLMKKQGYEVETASQRTEAMQKLHQFKPSIVLLDVLLSGTDGRELCREIKADGTMGNITVLMFSAHPGAAENIESYGADGFITKPVNTEALLQKLKKLTGQVS
ncbi:MAG TPA: response regulator [Flavisolibacter sp.]|nr:response regulator [Flavisolibacter sp.]